MSAIPNRSHCMYDVFAGQQISFCDFRITGFASVQRSAFGQKLWPSVNPRWIPLSRVSATHFFRVAMS